METTFTMNGDQHEELRRHLFPGDGKEAAAIVLCGHRAGPKRHRLLARKLRMIPFEACETRSEIEVTWSTDVIVPMLEEADRDGLGVIKIHSHPGGFSEFSALDDSSDKHLFACIAEWCAQDVPHASAVMLPDGRMIGRVVHADGTYEPLAQIAVIGDNWEFWRPHDFAEAPAAGFTGVYEAPRASVWRANDARAWRAFDSGDRLLGHGKPDDRAVSASWRQAPHAGRP